MAIAKELSPLSPEMYRGLTPALGQIATIPEVAAQPRITARLEMTNEKGENVFFHLGEEPYGAAVLTGPGARRDPLDRILQNDPTVVFVDELNTVPVNYGKSLAAIVEGIFVPPVEIKVVRGPEISRSATPGQPFENVDFYAQAAQFLPRDWRIQFAYSGENVTGYTTGFTPHAVVAKKQMQHGARVKAEAYRLTPEPQVL